MSLIKCLGDFFPRVVKSIICIAHYDLLILSCCCSFLQDTSPALAQEVAAGDGHMPVATQAGGGIFFCTWASAVQNHLQKKSQKQTPILMPLGLYIPWNNAECVSFCIISWIKGVNLCNIIFRSILFAWTHLCHRHGEGVAGRRFWQHHLPKSHFTLQIDVWLGHELSSLWVTSSPLSTFSLLFVPYFASQIRPDHLARMESQSWHWTRFYWTCNSKAGTPDSFCNPFSSPVNLRYLCGQKSWAGQGTLALFEGLG